MMAVKLVHKSPPNLGAIKLLEGYLQDAKEGKIRSVAICAVYGPGNRRNNWRVTRDEVGELNLAIDGLKHAFIGMQTEND